MLPAAAGHWISGLFCELGLLCGVHASSFLLSHCLSIWQLRLHVQLLVADASLFVLAFAGLVAIGWMGGT